jgi:hypothetical protein
MCFSVTLAWRVTSACVGVLLAGVNELLGAGPLAAHEDVLGRSAAWSRGLPYVLRLGGSTTGKQQPGEQPMRAMVTVPHAAQR